MRYLTPDILVERRLGENPAPGWDAAVICFRSTVYSQELVRGFSAAAVGYRVLSGFRHFRRVTCATVDAAYRETPELIQSFRGQGAQVINLETSALYAAAQSCGVRSVWIGYVSDLLVAGEWDDWYMDQDDMQRLSVQTCWDVCHTLAQMR